MKFMRMKVDKQSGTLMILAVVVICFMGTMFLINNSIGKSYALPSSGGSSVPSEIVIDDDEIITGYYTGTTLVESINAFIEATGITDSNEISALNLRAPATRITNVEGESSFDLYCLDRAKNVDSGTFTSPKELEGNYYGALYILTNAYSDNSVTKEQYYVTQHAIWYYLAKVGIDTSTTASRYVAAVEAAYRSNNYLARQIISQYNLAVSKSMDKNTLTIVGGDSVKLTLTEDGKYLESSDLRVEASVNDISRFEGFTVSTGDESVIVIDSSGNVVEKGTKLQNGNSFRIRIPVDATKDESSIVANIKVNGNFNEGVLYYYEPTVANVQRVLYVNSISRSVPAEAKLHFVKISKQDVTNGKELAGAKLKIERVNTDGTYNVVSEWTSTENSRYIFLEPGNYRLTEIVAPEGYELSKEVIDFTVKTGDEATEVVVMNNTPYVDTPDTASGIPLYVYIVGAIVLISGIAVVYVSMRPKKG